MSERPTPDLTLLRPILGRYAPEGRLQLIPTLLEAQEVYGFLPERVVEAIGEGLKVPLAEIHGVIEFYTMLYPRPTRRPIGGGGSRPMVPPPLASASGHRGRRAALAERPLRPHPSHRPGGFRRPGRFRQPGARARRPLAGRGGCRNQELRPRRPGGRRPPPRRQGGEPRPTPGR